jgi:hypothetical protein
MMRKLLGVLVGLTLVLGVAPTLGGCSGSGGDDQASQRRPTPTEKRPAPGTEMAGGMSSEGSEDEEPPPSGEGD